MEGRWSQPISGGHSTKTGLLKQENIKGDIKGLQRFLEPIRISKRTPSLLIYIIGIIYDLSFGGGWIRQGGVLTPIVVKSLSK